MPSCSRSAAIRLPTFANSQGVLSSLTGDAPPPPFRSSLRVCSLMPECSDDANFWNNNIAEAHPMLCHGSLRDFSDGAADHEHRENMLVGGWEVWSFRGGTHDALSTPIGRVLHSVVYGTARLRCEAGQVSVLLTR